jgi:hypothetical protein
MADSSVSLPRGALDARSAVFEQAVYDTSPVGAIATTLLLFLILVATLAGACALDGYAPFAPAAHGWVLRAGIWPGLVLPLLIAVALGMQRYASYKDRQEQSELMAVMADCVQQEMRLHDSHAMRRLRIATVLGALFGAASTMALLPSGVAQANPAMFGWFLVVNSFVAVLFARGIAQSVRGAEHWAGAIDQSLTIDLLRIDALNVIGRNSARRALIWFSVAAVILLLFAGSSTDLGTLAILVVSTIMGGWIFLRPMERVHRRIQAAKKAELESIRVAIERTHAQAAQDAAAAARLQGLLAYETRIEGVREWPFDQPTALRVAAYVLIPAIPWFGQAVVQRAIERVG